MTWTPCFSASFSFEPAPGPATTRSVFADTDPATFAPRLSARALASLRVIFSRLPVKTTVLPATGESVAGRSASSMVSTASRRSTSAMLWVSPKKSAIASATVPPIWSMASSSASAAASPSAMRRMAAMNAAPPP